MTKQPKPKRAAGFLVCDSCQRAVPFQGHPDQANPWPMHRCGPEIRPFDRWVAEDPTASATEGDHGLIAKRGHR